MTVPGWISVSGCMPGSFSMSACVTGLKLYAARRTRQ